MYGGYIWAKGSRCEGGTMFPYPFASSVVEMPLGTERCLDFTRHEQT